MEILASPPLEAGDTLMTRPVTRAPLGILSFGPSRTSCVMRAVIACPGFDFCDDKELLKRTGKIVPAGMEI
jgi:hypothetical protein